MNRTKGILAAMKYLSKRHQWKLEIDSTGVRCKKHFWRDFDAQYSLSVEETLTELKWGGEFKDLDAP